MLRFVSQFQQPFDISVDRLNAANLLSRPERIPVFVAWTDYEYLSSPLDGMLVHCRVTTTITFADALLYTWVRGTVRVKCFSQKHNIMSRVRAQTRTSRSGETSAFTLRPPQLSFHKTLQKLYFNVANKSVFFRIFNPFAGKEFLGVNSYRDDPSGQSEKRVQLWVDEWRTERKYHSINSIDCYQN